MLAVPLPRARRRQGPVWQVLSVAPRLNMVTLGLENVARDEGRCPPG